MMKKNEINILGHGAVVSDFLKLAQPDLSHLAFNIYTRKNIDHFKPSERLFYCCSTSEANLIKKTKQKTPVSNEISRMMVATHNLHITIELAKLGCFNQGTIFVVTNPSEIIAEMIYRITGNTQVYALGLSIDRLRLINILENHGIQTHIANKFKLAGNHWHRPHLVPEDELLTHLQQLDLSLDKIHAYLTAMITEEMIDCKPPSIRGAQTMLDALQSTHIEVSGFIPEHDCFGGGILYANQFIAIKDANNTLDQIYEHHRSSFKKILEKIEIT